jgi:diguanylate cyclase (GGDEF)-like protein
MASEVQSLTKRRFALLFDQVAGLPVGEADLSKTLIDTTMLRPVGLATASIGFLLMSSAAVILDGRAWTMAWFAADLAFLIARLAPAVITWRQDTQIPQLWARVILCAAFVMFATFGMGCAASFVSGIRDLQIASVIATMGLLAGLATRWAALPRLAALLFIVITLPMAFVVARISPFSGALFAILGAGTIVLTLQNNRTLIGMMRAERRARALANTDHLTGLLNRSGLEAELEALRSDAGHDVAVLYLDLNGFKRVNDRFGHGAGDTVLMTVADRLVYLAGEHRIARIGGDEFVIVLTGSVARSPRAFALQIGEQIGRPIIVSDDNQRNVEVAVSVSVGWAVGSLSAQLPAALLMEADRRLYVAKREAASEQEGLGVQSRHLVDRVDDEPIWF